MAKQVHDSVLDAALDVIATATTMLACSGASAPADRAAALSAALADVAMTGADFTKANGDVSGRKVTVAQKVAVPVDTSGTATHIALITASTLLYVTTCTSQALVSAEPWTFPAWDIEIRDPS